MRDSVGRREFGIGNWLGDRAQWVRKIPLKKR